jgi:transposase
MSPIPAQPTQHYGIGAVTYQTGQTVVLVRRHTRRRAIAALLSALLDRHPTRTVDIAWDNARTPEDDEVEAVVRGATGRLVLLYQPTYSPWLDPIEMLWRHFRPEVTHGALFVTVKALLAATRAFFDRYNQDRYNQDRYNQDRYNQDRYNQCPNAVLSIIGSQVPMPPTVVD